MSATDAATPLLALPPRRFSAARAELARALAEAGDPAAAAVRKLRRPTGLAWVMNRLAQERRDEVEALLAAGDRLRTGQRRAIAGGGAEDLRAAERDLRERARALRLAGAEVVEAEGRPATQGALARLELLLRAAATAPGQEREALRRGRLEREPEIVAGDLSGFALVPGGSREIAGGGARGTSAAAPERGARREAAAAARARKAAAAALARARAAGRKAEAAARGAEGAARRAAEAAERARDRAATLRARAEAARGEAARLEAALRALGPGGA